MLEDDLRKKCEKYLKENNIIYIHLSNSARSKYRNNNTRKYPGIPDLIIFLENQCIFVELKFDNNVMSTKQKEIFCRLESLGYYCFLVRDYNNFVRIFEN